MITKFFFIMVLAQGVWNAKLTPAQSTKDSDGFVYPGPKKEMKNRVPIPKDLPEACKGQKFCTIKPPDYPEEAFNEMFKNYKVIPGPQFVKDPMLGNRQGDPLLKDNCESVVTYDPLYRVAEVGTGEWFTVVQAPKVDYVQAVRLETCSNVGDACFTVYPSVPDIKTSCEQKYNHWEVVVSDGNNGTKTIKAELPVCCSCRYKFV